METIVWLIKTDETVYDRHMIIASIEEVRERFEEFLVMVEGGETIVVTRLGKPVCDIVPHRKEQSSAEEQE